MSNIVVTGAASGIGAATVKLLRSNGHDVVGVDLAGTEVTADLSTREGRREASAAVTDAADGVIDAVVCCAGLGPLSSHSGGKLLSVNYFGVIDFLDELRPTLARRERSYAVAISSSSTSTQPGIPGHVVDACLAGDEDLAVTLGDEATAIPSYPASKLALARWVRRESVTPQWIGAGIRLNAVAPGIVDTPMTSGPDLDPNLARALDFYPVPLGRRGRPEEIAALIAFLTSDAASLLCGSVLFADGGTDALLRQNDWPAVWEPSGEDLARHFTG
ncbi:NAD(P)-dependent dehydrogenase (short-subunit alcohol dehydrogenase family) [Rhodococcus sp. OK519]|uniref:SDR family oxidoreductase n=1 Tax=Rhodococcus sp. OK519 TaxID=2135729 RepID=UPI000D33F7DD|nr:NAD(P)-dependent dehydrogenase (short-subunit alcohol dehydrogenase family) [Rhodococcus sp. OK519]